MNRRTFIRYLAAGTAVALAPVPLLLDDAIKQNLPIIYGDGVHDDTAGFHAAMSGKPFIARNGCVYVAYSDDNSVRQLRFAPGEYRLISVGKFHDTQTRS